MPDDPKEAGSEVIDKRSFSPGELDDPAGWGTTAPPAEPPEELEPEKGDRPPEGESPADVEKAEPTEAEEEPAEEEKPEAEEEPFDIESLTPSQRKEFDRLNTELEKASTERKSESDRRAELEKRLAERGRELSAAKDAVKSKVEEHKRIMSKSEQDFNEAYDATLDFARNMASRADELEAQARECDESGDTENAEKIRKQAAEAKKESNRANQHANRIQNQYDSWHANEVVQHARDIEDSFLKHFPEYAEVRNIFDAFCKRARANILEVKGDLEYLHEMYQLCLDAERGNPENLRKITEASERLAMESGARKRGASGPGAGTSARATGPPPESDWTEEHFGGSSTKRDNPDIT